MIHFANAACIFREMAQFLYYIILMSTRETVIFVFTMT